MRNDATTRAASALACLALFAPGCLWVGIGASVDQALDSGSGEANFAPAVSVSNLSRILPSDSAGDTVVTVQLTVVDANSDLLSLRAEFIPAPGEPAQPMTLAADDQALIAAIAASPQGTTLEVDWQVGQDINLTSAKIDVQLQLTVSDGAAQSQSAFSNLFTAGNTLPVVRNVTHAGSSGSIAVIFTLLDDTADDADVRVTFSTDRQPALEATIAVGSVSGLQTSAAGVQHSVIWDSTAVGNLPNVTESDVVVQVIPSDTDEGLPVQVSDSQGNAITILVDNNDRALVSLVEPVLLPDETGAKVLELTLTDTESDLVDLVLQWKLAAEDFPELGTQFDNSVDRALALDDPDTQRQLQILSFADVPLEGIVEASNSPAGGDGISVSALLGTALLGSDVLVGKTLQLLRSAKVETLVSGLGAPGPLVVESEGDTVLVGRATGDVVRVGLVDGSVSAPLVAGLGTPSALALQPDTRDLLVTDAAGGRLLLVDLTAGTAVVVSDGMSSPQGVAVLSSSTALVTTAGDGGVLVVNLDDGSGSRIFSGLDQPRQIVMLPDGKRALIAERGGERIVEFDVLGRFLVVVTTSERTGLRFPVSLTLRPGGRQLLVGTDDGGSSVVAEVDLATRSSGVLATLSELSGGVAGGDDGALLFTELSSGELKVRDGVAAVTSITQVLLFPPRLVVNPSFDPVPNAGTRWRIPDGLSEAPLGLTSSDRGILHRLVWDSTRDGVPQDDIQVGATPFDSARGQRDSSIVPVTLIRFEENPSTVFDPDPASTDDPRDLVLADIDGDGRTDLASANLASSTLSVFFQEAAGSFRSLVLTVPGSGSPSRLAVGDLDGDGDLDLVSANSGTNDLTGFLQISAGVFEAAPSITLVPSGSVSPVAVVVGDLDGDGDLDLVVAKQGRSDLALFLQDTPGVFSESNFSAAVAKELTDLALGDLDGDGDSDIVAAGEGLVERFLQTSPGVFEALQSIQLLAGEGPDVQVEFADVDGDGDGDIAISDKPSGRLKVFRQTTPGEFENDPGIVVAVVDSERDFPFALEDVDGDGDLDLVAGDDDAKSLLVFLQTSPGSFEPVPGVTLRPGASVLDDLVSVAAEDLDGDGDPDLVAVDPGTDGILVFQQQRPGRFGIAPAVELLAVVSDFDDPVEVVVGDLDGNGLLDVASANRGSQSGTVFLQLFPGVFDPDPQVLRPPTATVDEVRTITLGDVDADGDLDVVLVSSDATVSTLSIFVRRSEDDFGAVPTLELQLDAVVDSITLADLDGDGDLDLACAAKRATPDSSLSIFRQTAPGEFELSPGIELGLGSEVLESPEQVVAADLDGDGDLDLVSANSVSGNLTGFRQISAGVFEAEPGIDLELPDGAASPVAVAVGDLDRDGDLDLVSANTNNSLTVFRQTSPGVFDATPGIVLNPGADFLTNPQAVALADVDRDGDLDVVASSTVGLEAVVVFLQLAPGVLETQPSTVLSPGGSTLDGVLSLVVADLDGDGQVEIVTANNKSDNLTIFGER